MTRRSLILRAVAVAVVGGLAAIAEHYGAPVPSDLRDHLTEAAIGAATVAVALWRSRRQRPPGDRQDPPA